MARADENPAVCPAPDYPGATACPVGAADTFFGAERATVAAEAAGKGGTLVQFRDDRGQTRYAVHWFSFTRQFAALDTARRFIETLPFTRRPR